MIPAFIPVIQKADALVFRDRLEEPADFGIAVDLHLLGEERMSKRVIRIILAGVFLFDNQVGDKIKDESSVITKPLCEHWTQRVLIDHFLDDNAGTDLQAAAPVSKGKFLRDLGIREVNLELFVRNHHG